MCLCMISCLHDFFNRRTQTQRKSSKRKQWTISFFHHYCHIRFKQNKKLNKENEHQIIFYAIWNRSCSLQYIPSTCFILAVKDFYFCCFLLKERKKYWKNTCTINIPLHINTLYVQFGVANLRYLLGNEVKEEKGYIQIDFL